MRVFQLLPTIAAGDAVSNDAIAIKGVLEDMGYTTAIFAENIDKHLPSGTAYPIRRMPKPSAADTVLYHLSTGSELNYRLAEMKAKKGIIYHNITPSYFFRPYNGFLTDLLDAGRKEAAFLADKADFCIADSEYNRQELIDMGYKCDISVRPVLIPFSEYRTRPDGDVLRKYDSDGFVNFLFVGRVAPNKKHEDIIKTFYCYKKHCNPNSRLLFVGSWQGCELYYKRLLKYIKALELSDVIFAGHVSFHELIAYYQVADIFLCMSEHEGFCVPIAEAMYFGVPIIAYDACAVSGTLGDAGILLKEKNPAEAAFAADRIIRDTTLRRELISRERKRQSELSYNNVKTTLEQQLKKYIG